MATRRPTLAELAEEVRRWESGELTPAGWKDAPEAVPQPRLDRRFLIRLDNPTFISELPPGGFTDDGVIDLY